MGCTCASMRGAEGGGWEADPGGFCAGGGGGGSAAAGSSSRATAAAAAAAAAATAGGGGVPPSPATAALTTPPLAMARQHPGVPATPSVFVASTTPCPLATSRPSMHCASMARPMASATEARGSSRTNSVGGSPGAAPQKTARARAMRTLCPPDSPLPVSPHCVPSPWGSAPLAMSSSRQQARSTAAYQASSTAQAQAPLPLPPPVPVLQASCSTPTMFSRTLPTCSQGAWGTYIRRPPRARLLPGAQAASPAMALMRRVLPLPVGPHHTPSCPPCST